MVKAETQANIRNEYNACRVGYDQAIRELICTGMTEAQADAWLFEKFVNPPVENEAAARNFAAVSGAFAPLVKTSERWPGLVSVDGHLVNPKTDEVFIVKTSKRGRDYLSSITSARRIKKILNLAKA